VNVPPTSVPTSTIAALIGLVVSLQKFVAVSRTQRGTLHEGSADVKPPQAGSRVHSHTAEQNVRLMCRMPTSTVSTSTSPLQRLFAPRSVAVVGASATPGKLGAAMLASVASFPGPVWGVNPSGAAELAGRPVVASVGDLPEPIDLALLCVPAAAVPALLDELGRLGVGAAAVCAAGMGESGDAGMRLQEAAVAAAAEHGIRLLGPNTSGFVAPPAGLYASFVPGVETIPAGDLAIVAQSGGVNHALAFHAAGEGLGVSLAVGLGNAADVDVAAVLDHVRLDPATRVVALHLEGVRSGRRVYEALKRLTAEKPVVALPVGGNEIDEFAQSHTGALLGSWRVTRTALRQAGAVVVGDTTALLDAARALRAGRLTPKARPGIALVTGQAGPGLLIAQRLGTGAVDLPVLQPQTRARIGELLPPITYQRNPVDVGRPGATFLEVARSVIADEHVDALAVYALHEPGAVDGRAIISDLRARSEKPIVFVTGGPLAAVRETVTALAEEGVAVFTTPERGAEAVHALVEDARLRARSGERPTATLSRLEGATAASFDEVAAKDLLDQAGFTTPARRVAGSEAEALAAFRELRAPVVVKLVNHEVVHKTEAGGVVVGVATADDLRAALVDVAASPAFAGRYLIEEMAGPGTELILGARRDPSFGPVVMLGLGGRTAEALDDVVARLVPLSVQEADRMVDELRGKTLLEAFRGEPAVDRAALADAICRLGRLLEAHPELTDIEINPLRWSGDRFTALDAVVLAGGAV
jgi:acyl-CoA synthetase (NDP forming)